MEPTHKIIDESIRWRNHLSFMRSKMAESNYIALCPCPSLPWHKMLEKTIVGYVKENTFIEDKGTHSIIHHIIYDSDFIRMKDGRIFYDVSKGIKEK